MGLEHAAKSLPGEAERGEELDQGEQVPLPPMGHPEARKTTTLGWSSEQWPGSCAGTRAPQQVQVPKSV